MIGTTSRELSSPFCIFPETRHVHRSVREEIRNFTITLDEDDFPNFLWEGEKADMQHPNRGFLRGEILVRVRNSCLSIYRCSLILVDNDVRLTWAQSCRDRRGQRRRRIRRPVQYAVHHHPCHCLHGSSCETLRQYEYMV